MNIYRNLLYLQEMDAESLKSIFNLIHFIQWSETRTAKHYTDPTAECLTNCNQI